MHRYALAVICCLLFAASSGSPVASAACTISGGYNATVRNVNVGELFSDVTRACTLLSAGFSGDNIAYALVAVDSGRVLWNYATYKAATYPYHTFSSDQTVFYYAFPNANCSRDLGGTGVTAVSMKTGTELWTQSICVNISSGHITDLVRLSVLANAGGIGNDLILHQDLTTTNAYTTLFPYNVYDAMSGQILNSAIFNATGNVLTEVQANSLSSSPNILLRHQHSLQTRTTDDVYTIDKTGHLHYNNSIDNTQIRILLWTNPILYANFSDLSYQQFIGVDPYSGKFVWSVINDPFLSGIGNWALGIYAHPTNTSLFIAAKSQSNGTAVFLVAALYDVSSGIPFAVSPLIIIDGSYGSRRAVQILTSSLWMIVDNRAFAFDLNTMKLIGKHILPPALPGQSGVTQVCADDGSTIQFDMFQDWIIGRPPTQLHQQLEMMRL